MRPIDVVVTGITNGRNSLTFNLLRICEEANSCMIHNDLTSQLCGFQITCQRIAHGEDAPLSSVMPIVASNMSAGSNRSDEERMVLLLVKLLLV
mmetsp:Transcript_7189/g.12895  ORF Transcript_7189/g.12895 Transcript_7189/m.12895 type:complete len:94 (+) Transcript_7189:1010-1291(+)